MEENIQALLQSLTDQSIIHIFADGACSGNPGPGGWGAVIIHDNLKAEISGGELQTTNNRMELMAAIESIRLMPESNQIIITTDSQYLKNGIELWIKKWKQNGWKTSDKKNVKNQDLWQALDALCQTHLITWKWVKGHNGVVENERADALARQGIIQLLVKKQ